MKYSVFPRSGRKLSRLGFGAMGFAGWFGNQPEKDYINVLLAALEQGVNVVGLPQHCALMENVPDFRKSVRSMTLSPIVEFLYWRMNWHTEHHMYAGVPCYNFKELYREIAHDVPEPRTLVGAWREMREIWQRQKVDPGYVFDTPLPPTANPAHTVDVQPTIKETELEASIGDLAPKGLSE